MEQKSRYSLVTDWLIAGVAVVLVIVCGKLLADGVTRFRITNQNEILDNLMLEENTLSRELLTDTRIYTIGLKYIKALADATVSFEFLPHNEIDTFLAVMQNLPQDVMITGFSYEGRSLHINCETLSEQSGAQFVRGLQEEEALFDGIAVHQYRRADDVLVLQITCIAAVAEPINQELKEHFNLA